MMKRVVGIGLLVALAVAGCTGPPAEGPEYPAAAELLEDVRAQTMDLSYEDPRYAPVLEAFRRVPEDDANRSRAEHWIALIAEAQARAAARQAQLEAQGQQLHDPAAGFHARIEDVYRARRLDAGAADGGIQPLPSGAALEQGLRSGQRAPAAAAPAPRPRRWDLDDRGNTRAYWHKRRDEADASVRKAEQRLDWARHSSCPKVQRRLGEYEARVEGARRARESLNDDARRAGAPPGWLRE